MQTINGKLIVEATPDLDNVKRNIEHLAKQFENLESQITVTSKQNKTEYLNQLVYVQHYLQKLERIYNSLFYTVICAVIGLTILSVWQGFNHDTARAKLESSTTDISTLKAVIGGGSR